MVARPPRLHPMESALRFQKPKFKHVLMGIVLGFFVLESELALEMTSELLLTAVESLEQAADNCLENYFGFDRRTSQCISAWSGLAILMVACYFFLKRLRIWCLRQCEHIQSAYALTLAKAREKQVFERVRLYSLVVLVAYFLIFF